MCPEKGMDWEAQPLNPILPSQPRGLSGNGNPLICFSLEIPAPNIHMGKALEKPWNGTELLFDPSGNHPGGFGASWRDESPGFLELGGEGAEVSLLEKEELAPGMLMGIVFSPCSRLFITSRDLR